MPLRERPSTRESWRRWPAVVLLAGLVVTAAGVAVTWRLYRDGEDQLLDQQTREAAAVLSGSIGRIEAALDGAATLADATNGNPERFSRYADSLSEQQGFAGMQLVHVDGALLAAGGTGPLIAPMERPDRRRLGRRGGLGSHHRPRRADRRDAAPDGVCDHQRRGDAVRRVCGDRPPRSSHRARAIRWTVLEHRLCDLPR